MRTANLEPDQTYSGELYQAISEAISGNWTIIRHCHADLGPGRGENAPPKPERNDSSRFASAAKFSHALGHLATWRLSWVRRNSRPVLMTFRGANCDGADLYVRSPGPFRWVGCSRGAPSPA